MDWGSFLGGIGQGYSQELKNTGTINQNEMARLQYQNQKAQQLGQQAYMNTLFPGSQSVPQPNGMQLPHLAQLPIIGPMGEAAGLWKQPPEMQPSTMGAQPQPGASVSPGTPPVPGGGMPAPQMNPAFHSMPGAQPVPQQPQQGMVPPAVRQEQGQRVESVPGFTSGMQVQQIAAAIDKANPGLRQSNPQAFAAAVQYAQQQVAELTQQHTEQAYKGAQTEELGARAEMERQHGSYWADRAQTAGVANKSLIEQFKRNDIAITSLENQKTRLAASFTTDPKGVAARKLEIEQKLKALYAKQDKLTKQLQGETTTQEAANVDQELGAPIKISNENLSKLKAMSDEQLRSQIEAWRNQGVSEESLRALVNKLKGA
jgi:hypothetical protein